MKEDQTQIHKARTADEGEGGRVGDCMFPISLLSLATILSPSLSLLFSCVFFLLFFPSLLPPANQIISL